MASEERVLHFPIDRNCGRLYLLRESADGPHWLSRVQEHEVLVDAHGTVTIPANTARRVKLRINARGAADLSFLTKLDTDVIASLELGNLRLDYKQMQYLSHLSGLTALDLSRCIVNEECLRQLSRFSQLRRLSLGVIESLPDAALASLASLEHLEWLSLNLAEMMGTGFANLRTLPRLAYLCINNANTVTEAGWRALGHLTALRSLDLASAESLTDNLMIHVGQLENLEELDVGHTRINGSGFVYLDHLHRLQILHANGSPILAHNLAHLRALPALEEVSLRQVQMEPAGFAYLAQVARLKRLYFYESLSSSNGLDHLLNALALEELDLTGSDLDAVGLSMLGRLVGLRKLRLDGSTGITDEGITHLANLANLRQLGVGPANIGDASLVCVGQMSQLEELWFGGTESSVAGLASLDGLSRMRSLSLYCPRVVGTGLTYLQHFTDLQELSLVGFTSVREDDLAFVSNIPCLKNLQVIDSNIAEAAIAHIASAITLRHLDLHNVPISDTSMHYLCELRELKSLSFYKCPISATGLRACLPLLDLERLDLEQTIVDDSVLPYLSQLPKLDTVVLSNSRVSSAGLDRIERDLPNCNIIAYFDP